MKTVTIPIETYQCLRRHLQKANELFSSLSVAESLDENIKAQRPPKETKSEKISKYQKLIESGKRGVKPAYLKK